MFCSSLYHVKFFFQKNNLKGKIQNIFEKLKLSKYSFNLPNKIHKKLILNNTFYIYTNVFFNLTYIIFKIFGDCADNQLHTNRKRRNENCNPS